jgi:hypothetical protein
MESQVVHVRQDISARRVLLKWLSALRVTSVVRRHCLFRLDLATLVTIVEMDRQIGNSSLVPLDIIVTAVLLCPPRALLVHTRQVREMLIFLHVCRVLLVNIAQVMVCQAPLVSALQDIIVRKVRPSQTRLYVRQVIIAQLAPVLHNHARLARINLSADNHLVVIVLHNSTVMPRMLVRVQALQYPVSARPVIIAQGLLAILLHILAL